MSKTVWRTFNGNNILIPIGFSGHDNGLGHVGECSYLYRKHKVVIHSFTCSMITIQVGDCMYPCISIYKYICTYIYIKR